MTLPHFEAYQADLDRRGHKPLTRNRKTHTIKTFFSFLDRQGLLQGNPAARLIPPKAQKRVPFRGWVKAAPKGVQPQPQRRRYHRSAPSNRNAVVRPCQSDCRDLELPARITRDPDNTGSTRVTRKGGKVATIPLNYKACQVLAAWLKARTKLPFDEVFVSKFKTPMAARAIQSIVAGYMKEADIKGASVHTLRHTIATHHVARGTDLKTIQQTLAYTSLATTTIYAVRAARQESPKEGATGARAVSCRSPCVDSLV